MKKAFLSVICLGAILVSCNSNNGSDVIGDILSQMTLEQKVRMLIGSNQCDDESGIQDKDQQMMAWATNSVPGSAASTYSIQELGVPPIVLADGPAGLRIQPVRDDSKKTYYCSAFPVGTALAASFDTDLQEKIGSAMGDEVLDYGVDILLGPGINIMRNPLCGRNFEYFSEDPVLSGYSGGAIVRGIQNAGVSATLKHYAANNAETNRCGNDSRVDERTLRELYLRNFAIAVREGNPDCIMTSYNFVNGEFASESTSLVEEILRKDIGFKGCVMTDWGAGVDPVKMVLSGNDLIMPGSSDFPGEIMDAVKNGVISEEVIDRNARRVLELVMKSPKWRGFQHSDNPDLASHASLIRNAAAECCVLLKNDSHALPVAKGTKAALFGTGSYEMISGGTGAGDVNKAYMRNLDEGLEQDGINLITSVSDAYKEHIEAEELRFADENEARGWWYGKVIKNELPETTASTLVKQSASEADCAIITICRRSGEGIDRDIEKDLYLRDDEIRLINEVSDQFHAQGKKVTVVLNVCGPVRLSDWEDKVDAILVAWLPGQEAGYSVADVICGDVNPSGKLPMTFALKYEDIPSQNFPTPGFAFIPKNTSFYHFAGHPLYELKDIDYQDYTEGLEIGYRYFTTENVPVSYPFGYGLSYSTFSKELTSAKVKNGNIEVKVKVTNSGSVAGKEVVQVYWSNPSILGEPKRQLLCFGKTSVLEPGKSQTMVLSAPVDDMAWFSEDESALITESGDYSIELCSDASTVVDKKAVTLRNRSVRQVTCYNNDDSDVRNATALASRIMGEKASAVCFETLKNEVSDVYEIESVGKKVVIRGNNANSMATGLNRYLQEFCLTQVSWFDFNPVELPEVMPSVPELIRVESIVPYRFFLNYCTYGYTLAFWQWEQWEHFIDWMALNGVNMPLAQTGHEAVLQKVYRKFGMTDDQIRGFFTGPAHLPWNRMSNIDGWQGPLPQKWIDGQAELQKRILERERSLNMRPVLPGFSGHIPRELPDVIGAAMDTTRVCQWCGFSDEYNCTFLNPKDPHFAAIQKEYLTEQTKMYGTDHIYSIDSFNEVDVPSWDPETLSQISKDLYNSVAAVDSDAVWLQMGWLFQNENWTSENIEAYLTAVPKGHLLMLDYVCDYKPFWKRTNSFYGHDFIWCYLGNFGGSTVIEGKFCHNDAALNEALNSAGPSMVGIGATLEGLGVNEPIYDHVMSRAWNSGITLDDYIDNVADRHLGRIDASFRHFWHDMDNNVRKPHHLVDASNSMKVRPSFTYHGNWTMEIHEPYNSKELLDAWEILKDIEGDSDQLAFDKANILRQMCNNEAEPLQNQFAEAYRAGDRAKMVEIRDTYLALFDRLVSILETRPEFSLERWVENARSWGDTKKEKDYYERNARTIISVWGNVRGLYDYAQRDVDGLVKYCYKPRWAYFFDSVIKAFDENRPLVEDEDEEFHDFDDAYSQIESDFCSQTLNNR